MLVAASPRDNFERGAQHANFGHRFSQPGPNSRPDYFQYGLAERLVGEALQLGRYQDPQVLEVARREMAEAYELDDRQLDRYNIQDCFRQQPRLDLLELPITSLIQI